MLMVYTIHTRKKQSKKIGCYKPQFPVTKCFLVFADEQMQREAKETEKMFDVFVPYVYRKERKR